MLKCYKETSESSTLGRRVAMIVGELRECESLSVFESNFKERLRKLKTGNNLHADTLYKLKYKDRWTNSERLLIVKDHYSTSTGKTTEKIIFSINK